MLLQTEGNLTLQVFGSLAGLLSELDVLLSFADLASSCPTPYTRPAITSSVLILMSSAFTVFAVPFLLHFPCIFFGPPTLPIYHLVWIRMKEI